MKTRRAFIQTGAVALCGLAAAPALAKPRKPKDADWMLQPYLFELFVPRDSADDRQRPRRVRGGPVGS